MQVYDFAEFIREFREFFAAKNAAISATDFGERMGPSELRRLRQLEEENRKLKQIVADLSLDKAMLQAVLAKKL